jgi:hypothetical protein
MEFKNNNIIICSVGNERRTMRPNKYDASCFQKYCISRDGFVTSLTSVPNPSPSREWITLCTAAQALAYCENEREKLQGKRLAVSVVVQYYSIKHT